MLFVGFPSISIKLNVNIKLFSHLRRVYLFPKLSKQKQHWQEKKKKIPQDSVSREILFNCAKTIRNQTQFSQQTITKLLAFKQTSSTSTAKLNLNDCKIKQLRQHNTVAGGYVPLDGVLVVT